MAKRITIYGDMPQERITILDVPDPGQKLYESIKGYERVTARAAGEVKAHSDFIGTHVDYGAPLDPSWQVMLPGIGDDGTTDIRNTWGYYLLTGPNKTKLGTSLTGARALFGGIRSPLKWPDPYAYSNIQPNYLARKYGIKFLAGVGTAGQENGSMDTLWAYLQAMTILGESFPALRPDQIFDGLECSNEPGSAAGLSLQVANVARRLRASTLYDDVAIVMPSFVKASNLYYTWGDNRSRAGKKGSKVRGNTHPYPGGETPEPAADVALAQGNAQAPGEPVYVTESGYHTITTATQPHPGVSLSVQASYTVRMYLANARKLPIGSRTMNYQLVEGWATHNANDGETGFGLVDTTTTPWTPKPAYWALRAMMLLMEDNGYVPGTADVTVPLQHSGELGTTEFFPVYFSDGGWGTWIWDNRSIWNTGTKASISVATYPVNVAVPSQITTVRVADPVATETTYVDVTQIGGNAVVTVSATNPKFLRFS